jgi:outer membrane protein assembly factor BamB
MVRFFRSVTAICAVLLTASHAFASEKTRVSQALPKSQSRLFRLQYHIDDTDFCHAGACVDFDNNGQRELLFASRKTKQLQLLNAANGTVRWSRKMQGDQQSLSAFDLDGDGLFEILYSVSGPGRLYVLDANGNIRNQWDSGDWKLGNSAVILDADGDGILDGYFGSRNKFLLRLNMQTLQLISKRSGWSQCGCHTTAMDVDGDGRWDLFAGSGDDNSAKGVLHRYDPISLESLWSFNTNDNASSADPVLVDIDGDGQVEIIKSVDNYKQDDAHDAVYAFETDGKILWKVGGLSGEDSPNVADLDGDGSVEIVGMTFGSEVYCLDAKGRFKWRKRLRPQLDNHAHAYMTPILCDLNGDKTLEILAMTNDGYFKDASGMSQKKNAVLFALSATGEILDRFDLGEPRYWGEAFVCNVDDDPYLELVLSGSGGLDVIETKGFGANTEYFQRRRSYQRLNVLPWAYEDTYFLHRGQKRNVVHRADSLVLKQTADDQPRSGSFVTDLLTLPPGCLFDSLRFETETPVGTNLAVNVLSQSGKTILSNVKNGKNLQIRQPVRLQFLFSTTRASLTPRLDSYSLSFIRRQK